MSLSKTLYPHCFSTGFFSGQTCAMRLAVYLESQFDLNVVFEPSEFEPVKFDCICVDFLRSIALKFIWPRLLCTNLNLYPLNTLID